MPLLHPTSSVAWVERSDTQDAIPRVSLRSTRATPTRSWASSMASPTHAFAISADKALAMPLPHPTASVAWVERSDTQDAIPRVSLRSTRATSSSIPKKQARP